MSTGPAIATRRAVDRRRHLLWCLLPCVAAWAQAADSPRATYSIAPVPAWVEPAAPDLDAPPPAEGVRHGRQNLLEDIQVHVLPKGRDTYNRYVIRALTAEGVEQIGEINLQVDPTYQTLQLHHVRIIRDGKTLEQLGHARITVVPVESDLESRIYNGTYSVNILLEGLRIGDVVDYAFGRRSRPPFSPEHFSLTNTFGWSAQMHDQRLRILYPLDRHLRLRAHGAEVTPRETVRGGERELRFAWHDRPIILDDSSRPAWYTPWPWLEVSDWADWNEVAASAAKLYEPATAERAALSSIIASIRDASPTDEGRTQRALQFVQEQIRYTSISIGAGSEQPATPQVVLSRRFGDCKDKSLLLVALLRGLGIEAVPAFVHTTHGHSLPERLPSSALFDHVITRVSLPGRTLWLDPTADKQLFTVTFLDPPDFEFALPLTAATQTLEAIPRPATDVLRRDVSTTIDASHGLTAPATLDVVTRYLGPGVDSMRATLDGAQPAERAKRYLNYYTRLYPGIESVAAPKIEESAAHDALVVSEHYRLKSGFDKDADGVLHLSVSADEISEYSEKLQSSVRSSPLAIPFPVNVVQTFVVALPEDFPVKPEVVSVENPAFRYRSEVRLENQQLHVRYSYVALKDHVPVADLARYLSDRARMRNDLGYTLNKSTATRQFADFSIAPLPAVVLLVMLAAGWLLAIRLYRFDPPPRDSGLGPDTPRGIRGWLVLPALNALLLPLVVLWLAGVYALYVESDVWRGILEVVNPEARGWIRGGLLASIGASAALLPLTIVTALLFFRKRTSAPWTLIGCIVAIVVYGTFIQAVLTYSGLDTTSPQQVWGQFARDVIGAAAWCTYLVRSTRVRATFVERRRAGAPHPRPDQPLTT